ncbi:hypothetical protein C7H08_15290 [Marinobacter halophilus]|uniref:Uncharacterized protein n=1 Tax=Marinobacter halophilus TaxID=1323740 RepID=A0A2T1K8V2_9GAMM|nr:hypothetical protein C7H08_15290 [Marinobacter halophilus]
MALAGLETIELLLSRLMLLSITMARETLLFRVVEIGAPSMKTTVYASVILQAKAYRNKDLT